MSPSRSFDRLIFSSTILLVMLGNVHWNSQPKFNLCCCCLISIKLNMGCTVLKIMEAAWFCVYWNWEYQLELEKKHKELEDFQKHCFIFIGFWLYFYIFHILFCFCIVRILVESKQRLSLHHFVSFTHCSSVSCLKNLWDEIMLSFIYTSKIFFVWEIDFCKILLTFFDAVRCITSQDCEFFILVRNMIY